MSRTWAQRTVAVPVGVAVSRLPAAVGDGRARLTVAVDDARVSGSSHRYAGRWTDGRRGGAAAVEIAALSAGVSQVDVGLEGGARHDGAGRLADALCGVLEPREATSPPSPPRRPRRRAVAVVGAATALLVALGASRMLAPPPPVALDDAVTAYRIQEVAGAAAAQAPAVATDRETDEADTRRPAARPTEAVAGRHAPRTSAARVKPVRTPATPQLPAGRRQPAAVASQPRSGAEPQRSGGQSRIQPGVYTYDTAGYEEIDRPSSRHTYPSQTAITVRRTDCGFVSRWQPFEHRWDELGLCVGDGGALLQRMSTNREFYRQRQRSDYICEGGSVAWLATTGSTWRSRCSDGETTVAVRGRNTGREPVTVDGETIRALHFVLDGTISGANDGTMRIERWIEPETGLLLRFEGRTEATSQTPLGAVSYREEVTLRLRSTTPRT